MFFVGAFLRYVRCAAGIERGGADVGATTAARKKASPLCILSCTTNQSAAVGFTCPHSHYCYLEGLSDLSSPSRGNPIPTNSKILSIAMHFLYNSATLVQIRSPIIC